jgi:hypothetical protein
MRMEMIGNWQISHYDEPKRFLLYANAYLQASRSVCLRMLEESAQHTWPNAAVAMMLAAHSVELFLKGGIARQDSAALAKIHRIEDLADTYFRLLPVPEFHFEVPFVSEYLGFSEDEIAALKKEYPTPSVQFRYPVKSQGVEWRGVHGFETRGFLTVVRELESAYERIGEHI